MARLQQLHLSYHRHFAPAKGVASHMEENQLGGWVREGYI